MPNPMDAVTNLLGGFVDKFEPAIREHVERNVDETKTVLIQRLPPALQEVFNTGGSGERSLDRGLVDAIMGKVQNRFGNVLENIQEKLWTLSKEQVDRASTGTVDFLTQAIVKESKECVTNKVGGLLAHQKKKGEEGSRGVSLDFINQGRQSAIARAMEQIEPKVHESGLEIYNKLVSNMPEAVQQLLIPGGSGEASRGILDNGFRKILDRVREVVQQVVGNIMPTFEKSILQNIQRELESKVPDQNLVLGFVQKFASKIELGKFGNLGTLLGGVLGAGAVGGAAAAHNSGTAGDSPGNYANSSQGQYSANPGHSQGAGSQDYGQTSPSNNYNNVPGQGNYSQPSNHSSYSQPANQNDYNRPANYNQQHGQGDYSQESFNQPQSQGMYQPSNQNSYSQSQSQGNYDQPQSQSGYGQTPYESNYSQSQGQSNYGQSQNQGNYNQTQSQGSYTQPSSQGNYNQPQSYNQPQNRGNYSQPPSQGNLAYQTSQSNLSYESTGRYNPSQEYQSSSRGISNAPLLSPQANLQPGGFAIPTPESYQQPEREDEIFPGGFYLPKQ